jgi:ABC-type transporter Mla subunit MlaD
MATRAQNVKLGVFAIAATILATMMVIIFTARTPFTDDVRYYVRVPDAKGVTIGSQVYLYGVRVGTVGDIEPFAIDRQSVRLTLEVDPDYPIDADAKAFLEMKGVTGLKDVNIRDGTGKGGTLEPESYIPYGESLFDTLANRTEELLASAGLVLESTQLLIEQVREAMGAIDSRKVDHILERTDTLMTEMTRTSTELTKLVRASRGPLTRSLTQVERTAVQAERVLGNMNQTITQLRGMAKSNDGDLRATMRNLRQASESFETLGRELRQRPSLLLFSDPPKDRELP